MNQVDFIQVVRELLETEDNEGCSDDLTVVSAEPIAKLRELLKDYDRYAKRDDKGLYEDHRQETTGLRPGKFFVIGWSCRFETRISIDDGIADSKQFVRDMAHEIDVPEGTARYVDDTFDIEYINPEEK